MKDWLHLGGALLLLVLALLLIPAVIALFWAVLGAFGLFWFLIPKRKVEPEWWHTPFMLLWCGVYWVVCQKFGLLGLVIPAIMHSMQTV